MAKDPDPDELAKLDMEPEQAIKAALDGAEAENTETSQDSKEPRNDG